MTSGEKIVWAALYAQALKDSMQPAVAADPALRASVSFRPRTNAEIAAEAVLRATSQFNALRAYVKNLDVRDPSAPSYTAVLVLE